MNRRRSLALGCALAVMVLGVAGQGVAGDEDPSAAVIEGLVSTLPSGVVSIKADPTLSNGRLVLRVVAFNKGAAPVTLNAADIKLYTSANQPVALLPLDQLIAEVSSPAPGRPVGSATGYGGQALATGQDGRLDVSGFSGANQTVAGGLSSQVQAQIGAPGKLSKADQAQVDTLKAAILQSVEVAPNTAAGGQIVTDKLKFDRDAPRELKMVVRFNGEKHGFIFGAPPAR